MKNTIAKLERKENLSSSEMQEAMEAFMARTATKEGMASFLLALRAKGPNVEEITAAAQAMREFSLKVKTKHKVIFDTCGTGGDKKGTFNISTAVAFIVAAAGVAVAKHGNRSVSSHCGSADVLEALGININVDPGKLGECLDRIGIAFLFAQKLHPAMKNVAPVRKELGVETIFNILGPLTNPAGATHQMVGVYRQELVETVIKVLKNLGLKKALVVHGADGLDEVTTTAETFMAELDGASIKFYSISPKDFQIKLASSKDLTGKNAAVNAKIILDIFSGKRGCMRDIVVLNAACALYTAEASPSIKEGIRLANHLIDSGKAKEKFTELKEFTNHLG